jgi:methylthioribose-1-phosphate isomerase
MRTIDWDEGNNTITLIDQTLLPGELKVIQCKTVVSLCEAIKSMRVRGAPALGAAGGYGVALAAYASKTKTLEDLNRELEEAASALKGTRPTAVNLSWGVDRVRKAVLKAGDPEAARRIALEEAKAIADEDVEKNRKLGAIGAELLEDEDTVLTHCNAGRLACVDWGTALGIVRSAIEQGKNIKVIACETRPLNQGSRITAWELIEDRIPATLIIDSAAGYVMRKKRVDKVIVGADRIVRDAVFNKIGTYTLSVLAKENGVPFYVAAPLSTFDLESFENEIEIEVRDPDELRFFQGKQTAPLGVEAYNPAFDATPMENVTAIITEKGIFYPPLEKVISH